MTIRISCRRWTSLAISLKSFDLRLRLLSGARAIVMAEQPFEVLNSHTHKTVAIVVVAIGQQHHDYWQRYARKSCQAYAQKHGYDLIVITRPLEASQDALSRSFAWQKCLVLSQAFLSNYEQVVLLDSDIVINAAAAPAISEQVPVELVGGVIAGSHIAEQLRIVLLGRLRQQEFSYARRHERMRADQDAYYRHFGLTPQPQGIVQTGVLVGSPQHHRQLFESVYTATGVNDHRSFEQIPLSHALLNAGVFCPIDTRFNRVFYETMLVHYPYLNDTQTPCYEMLATWAVQTELANSFFLHFAYVPPLAAFLPG